LHITLAIEGSKATAGDVITLAKLYEGYVLGQQTESNNIDDVASDIPF
jgi:hypothetical protein